MSPDPLDILWRSADVPNPVLTPEDLAVVPPEVMARLTALGILREAASATHVICDNCFERHVEEVVMIKYPDGQTRFFIPCPESLRVEVPRERLRQWMVSYVPLLAALMEALGAPGTPEEVVAGRVWNLGRAPLAGKSKTLWAARGLAWQDAAQIAAALPEGRSPILFFLGQAPEAGLVNIPHESIIELRTMVQMKDQLIVDREAIESQVTDVAAPPSRKQPKKRAERDATVGALKRELHERILAFKSAIRHADDADEIYDLPRVTQKELAAAIKEEESAVSRAIKNSDDPWLKVLLQTIVNPDLIRKYSRS